MRVERSAKIYLDRTALLPTKLGLYSSAVSQTQNRSLLKLGLKKLNCTLPRFYPYQFVAKLSIISYKYIYKN